MEFIANRKHISTFATIPRPADSSQCWKNIDSTARWCAEYQFTGPMLFTGGDTFVEPWVCAQSVIERYGVSPLIPVNPVYMHPFSVANFVSSHAHAFEKKLYLNMVTGTRPGGQQALADEIDHDARYDRLLEYIKMIQNLLSGAPEGVTVKGDYYSADGLALTNPVASDFHPEFFVAGHSDMASYVKEESGAVGMQMLMPDLAANTRDTGAIHFGLITRTSESEAWKAAEKRFPESRSRTPILERSINGSDSVWKKRLKFAADTADRRDNGYWLAPFRNLQADCPYFVGNHEQVKDLVVSLVNKGVGHIVVDIPPDEQSFAEVATAFQMARDQLANSTIPKADPHSVLNPDY